MATLLAIHGTVTRPGRLHQALEAALKGIEGHPGVSTSLLDLGQYRVSFADGRPLTGYSDDTQAVVEQVTAADMYLIGTPIYRASFTAALTNILDLTPVDGLMGKPCGLVGMGATDHHYLALDAQLRPVLAWFGARVLPVPVYLQSRHFQDGQLSDPQAVEDLQSLARAVVAAREAQQAPEGPPPLAARY